MEQSKKSIAYEFIATEYYNLIKAILKNKQELIRSSLEKTIPQEQTTFLRGVLVGLKYLPYILETNKAEIEYASLKERKDAVQKQSSAKKILFDGVSRKASQRNSEEMGAPYA